MLPTEHITLITYMYMYIDLSKATFCYNISIEDFIGIPDRRVDLHFGIFEV